MISFNLGTPRVTFFADTPAKWKVLRVIYVAGSPIACAPMLPTISPGWIKLYSNLDLISPRIQSNDIEFSLSFMITFLEFKMDLM